MHYQIPSLRQNCVGKGSGHDKTLTVQCGQQLREIRAARGQHKPAGHEGQGFKEATRLFWAWTVRQGKEREHRGQDKQAWKATRGKAQGQDVWSPGRRRAWMSQNVDGLERQAEVPKPREIPGGSGRREQCDEGSGGDHQTRCGEHTQVQEPETGGAGAEETAGPRMGCRAGAGA